MAEYIGSRISLISKRDIRYVGTLHEISSENSTVALEQVKSFGTEGRDPENEIPPSDNIYEYIVFRGSDVKDLRIEKDPVKEPVKQPQVPDDPAILGNARPTGTPSAPLAQKQQSPPPSYPGVNPQNQPFQQQQRFGPQQSQPGPGRFQQQPPYPYNYPPPNQRFGPQGPQGFQPYGHPGMAYGSPPPGWYPPPGQGYPHPPPGQFYPPPGPFGPPSQPPMQQGQVSKPETSPDQPQNNAQQAPPQQELPVEKPAATVKLPTSSVTPAPPAVGQSGPPPPTESKPNVTEALAPPAPIATIEAPAAAKQVPTGTKSGRIMPAVPIMSPQTKSKAVINGSAPAPAQAPAQAPAPAKSIAPRPTQTTNKSLEDANRDARAAVAAAMAKLPPAPGQAKKQTNGESAIDNLTKKVNEMRTSDHIRTSRQPGTGGYAAGHRGGRGGYRGGRPRDEQQTKKMEVPKTDYDFAEANAKFNKQDLVKEAIATGDVIGSPIDGSNDGAEPSANRARAGSETSMAIAAAPGYNKSSSFFDNISSEIKDRDDKKLGGREFRSEEQKKNLETFGQGSVDNGYRGRFQGRSRGRGRGYRGSFPSRGRGSIRGRGSAVAAET